MQVFGKAGPYIHPSPVLNSIQTHKLRTKNITKSFDLFQFEVMCCVML